MNKILQWGLLAVLSVCSSCATKPSCDGTYEGVLPAADCAGTYVMLAVDGNRYELFEKYISRPGSFLTCGDATLDGKVLRLDNGKEFTLTDGGLSSGEQPLRLVSSDKQLADLYTTLQLKETRQGEDASLKLYEKGGVHYADLSFKGEEYALKSVARTDSAEEYKDGTASLRLPVDFVQKAPFVQADFTDGKNDFRFTLLAPASAVYVVADGEGPASFDVVYYNDGNRALVKLLCPDLAHCYTLPQTEASAKTAVYADDKVEWSIDNENRATLRVDGKAYTYKAVSE